MACIVSSNGDECTLASDIRAVLTDESMWDVDLVGNDGGRVSASRFVLGARSPVFRRMLFGTFKESTSKEVHLDYDHRALSILVAFCYTDELLVHFPRCTDDARARTLVRVYSAAHYLELPALETKVAKFVQDLLEARKPLSCAIYDETFRHGPDASKLRDLAVETMRSYPEDSLLSDNFGECGVSMLGSEAIQDLVCDNEIRAEEVKIFLALKEWVEEEHSSTVPSTHRVEIAKNCAAQVNLTHISPSDLIGVVQRSGLVPEESILSAIREQSLSVANSSIAERDQARRSVLLSKGVKFARVGLEVQDNQLNDDNAGAECDAEFIQRALRAERRGHSFSSFRAIPLNSLSRISVEGAGFEAVNGTYLEDGTYGGFPKYCKKGEWQSKDVTFVIYRWKAKVWYLSIFPHSGEIGDAANDLYMSDFSTSGTPDSCVWRRDRAGQDPPPHSKFIPASRRRPVVRKSASAVF